jgi:hypothetical protein
MHLMVLDDLRELPYGLITTNTVHCTTNEEFDFWLDEMDGEPILAFLDHDAGGEAFGMETFRESITKLVDAHIDGLVDVVIAYVITMNPHGRDWIVSELERGEIDFTIDAAGAQIGMKCPEGWGYDGGTQEVPSDG